MAAIGIAGGATGALCLAAGARRALSNDCKLRRALTADEWSFVLKQRLSDVITGVAFALHNPGWTAGYISLAGSAEQMVAHYAVCSTVMAVLNFLGEPLVAALSDRFGRKPFLMWGRLGMCAWFLTYTRVDLYGKLWMRLAGEAVCFGVVGVGHWTVFAAAHSDRFGSRPSLSAQIQSADRLWSLLGKVTGNVAGVLLTDQIGALQVGHISHGLGLVTFWLLSQLPETLTKEKQKPFRFTHSNPLSNLVLLFCNGPGLRKLSLSALLYLGCNNVNMAHSGVQLGTLGWAVNAKSLFDSGTQIVQAGSEAFVAPQILAWGGRPSFQSVSLVAALAYAIQGLAAASFVLAVAGRRVQSVLYALAFCLVQATGGVCQTAMRVMVVKQGIEVTDAGRAELNSAFAGLGKITQMFMPLVWASCLHFFSTGNSPAGDGRARFLRWGAGGHLYLVAAGRLLSYAILRSAGSDELYLADAQQQRQRRTPND